jgi:hypothetical protein
VTDGSAAAYLVGLEERLRADGCAIEHTELGGVPALVARRSDFRLRWFATRLHLFTVAIAQQSVDPHTLFHFSNDASRYARQHKPGLPVGLQTGVAVFPVVVCSQPAPEAGQVAAASQRVEFSCMTRPVVVDAATGRAAWFQGKVYLGRAYAGHLVERGHRYFG